MAGMSKILPVPYIPQPTDTTCQSTVLKMLATYVESEVLDENGGATILMEKRLGGDLNTRYRPEGDKPFLHPAGGPKIEKKKTLINRAPGRPGQKKPNNHPHKI